jgi:hypothetical protein
MDVIDTARFLSSRGRQQFDNSPVRLTRGCEFEAEALEAGPTLLLLGLWPGIDHPATRTLKK